MINRIGIAKLLVAVGLSGGAVYVKQFVFPGECPSGGQTGPAPGVCPPRQNLVCTGRVESVGGELEIAALISGRLAEVRVADGDRVCEGDILAILEGARETEDLRIADAGVDVARFRLKRIEAGNGKEEVGSGGFSEQKAARGTPRVRAEQSRGAFAAFTRSNR